MSRRMVVLLVDALGWELAGRTPGLADGFAYRRRLETVLGFSSGALPTIFTGRPPAAHGRFLMYRRARGDTPFSGFEWLRLLPARAQRSWRLTRLLTRAVERRGVRGYFNLYEVPRPLLAEFDLAERDDIFAPGGLPGDSLWDVLARRSIPWRGWNWRGREEDHLAALEDLLERGDERFLFCYTADLDDLLHREGSEGPGVQARLARYRELFQRLRAVAAARGDELWLYLLSDHGMVDVTRTVDMMGTLATLPWRWPRDYLAFFDSTMARFWWRERHARESVRAALCATGAGRWLEPSALEAGGALFPDHAYGEDIFLLDPGVLMLPSFMGSRPVRAMHGFDPAHPDMAALLWSSRPVPDRVRGLLEVRGYLESELDALLGVTA